MNDMELVDRFLMWKEFNQGRSILTVNKYRRYLKRLSEWLPCPVEDADTDALEAFVGPYAFKEMKLTAAGRQPMISAIREFYAWMKREGVVQSSAGASLVHPKAGRKLPVAMQLSSAEKLLMQPDLNTFKGLRDAAMLVILIGCGPRVSGVARLNESDLIWTQETVKSSIKLKLTIKFTEKGGKQRLVPAHPDAAWLLRAYLGHEDMETIDRTLPDMDKVLFVSKSNNRVPRHEYYGEARRISAKYIDEMIKLYGERAGIPRQEMHAHAMRHLFGTELAESDEDLLIRQALLGHADAKTTEIYTHLAIRKLETVIDRASPLGKIANPGRNLREYMDNVGDS